MSAVRVRLPPSARKLTDLRHNRRWMLKSPIKFYVVKVCSTVGMIEVQMKKGLWWIPRHPETKKGVVIDETLRGAESKH